MEYRNNMSFWKFRNLVVVAIALIIVISSCKKDGESASGSAAKGKRPNIIVLTVDTLRADHMALYGYHRDTMPAIGEFAKTAVVFDQAVVSRGNTRASYASMLTALYPFRHGQPCIRFDMAYITTTLSCTTISQPCLNFSNRLATIPPVS
jgi:hypothetical protein